MTDTLITGRLIAAARALTGISQADLAIAAAIPVARLAEIEAGGAAPVRPAAQAESLGRALERFGALFVAEGDGMGAGVRLKFSRQDARQIARLEGEGGRVADDDVP